MNTCVRAIVHVCACMKGRERERAGKCKAMRVIQRVIHTNPMFRQKFSHPPKHRVDKNFGQITFSAILVHCNFYVLPHLALTLVRNQMAWLGIIIFVYMDIQDHTICCVWIHFIPTSLNLRREEKHLVWAGIEARSSCFTSDRSNH